MGTWRWRLQPACLCAAAEDCQGCGSAQVIVKQLDYPLSYQLVGLGIPAYALRITPIPAQIVVLFCRLALLGAAIGTAFGFVTSTWLGRIVREPTLEASRGQIT